jgi:uncharacterized membrane protein YuzA (DUF378 family)
MKLHKIAWVLVIIGGINWLLVGLGGFMGGNWNLVTMLLGSWPAVEWIVYILVGLSAVYELFAHKKVCKDCGTSAPQM